MDKYRDRKGSGKRLSWSRWSNEHGVVWNLRRGQSRCGQMFSHEFLACAVHGREFVAMKLRQIRNDMMERNNGKQVDLPIICASYGWVGPEHHAQFK